MAVLPGFATILTICFIVSTVLARKVTNPARVPKDATLLSKVASLTLRDGRLTSSRRVKPVPQLECIGPKDICDLYKVDLMRCTNDGADYDAENIQWSCKASLPEDFKLGSTEVICEGYESSDDPYVLKGSCGVEYRLLLTDKGEERFAGHQQKQSQWLNPDRSASQGSPVDKYLGYLFMALFVFVLFIIVRGIWTAARNNTPRLGGGGNRRNGGDDDDPPPPYDGPPPYGSSPRKKTQQATSTRASSSRSGTRAQTQEGQQWRPGFWTGALTGAAAAGYAATRGQNRNQPPAQQQRQQMQERSFPSFSSSSSGGFSTQQHESTGFGGTRRR